MHCRFSGPDHVYVGNVLEDLAFVARERQDYAAAETASREAERVYRKTLPAQTLPVVRARLALGEALLGRGALGDAEPLLLAGFTAFRDRRMPGALGESSRRRAIEGLIQLYGAQGRAAEAAKYAALDSR